MVLNARMSLVPVWCALTFLFGVSFLAHTSVAQHSAGNILPAKRIGAPSNQEHKFDLSRIGSRGIGQGVNLYSQDAERVLGEKLAAQIRKQSDVISDRVLTEYINRIAGRIANHSDVACTPIVTIVNDVEPNAYSLPGCFVYIHSGLIIAADDEAELASALAHEIGHLASRHLTKLITKQKTWK